MKLESFSLSPSAPCSVPIIQTSSLPLQLNELALFAGAGGGILGGLLCGFRTVCAVEWDAYARDVLVARQNDGCLAPFPIWDDVQTFDGRPWRGIVDVVSGGFPCQDISVAGKGEGIDGTRSGMWHEMRRIIGEVRPKFVLVENSPALTTRGGVRVTADLAALGYVGSNGVLGAVHAGAPHQRERMWFVADSESERLERYRSDAGKTKISKPRNDGASANMGHTQGQRWHEEQAADHNAGSQLQGAARGPSGANRRAWWEAEPDVGRVAHGVAARVDRLRCLGNGQVPAVVRLAWDILKPKES